MRIGYWMWLVWALSGPSALAADPDTLWKIVHEHCVPNQTAHQDPAPCASVDLAHGFALLKDIRGATQYLLIPTERIGGIESPEILQPGAPNYWDAAWRARTLVEAKAGQAIPRDELGLAINSPYGRTQNQLHIHIDCVLPEVRAAVKTRLDRIGPTWADLDADIAGHRYRAMRLDGAELGDRNPFKLLAEGDADARQDMARETLAVVGVTFADEKPGFVLLAGRANLLHLDMASSETLLDHDCRVLKPGQ